jgi:hypothetical protein
VSQRRPHAASRRRATAARRTPLKVEAPGLDSGAEHCGLCIGKAGVRFGYGGAELEDPLSQCRIADFPKQPGEDAPVDAAGVLLLEIGRGKKILAQRLQDGVQARFVEAELCGCVETLKRFEFASRKAAVCEQGKSEDAGCRPRAVIVIGAHA